jgi:hypothetical protein
MASYSVKFRKDEKLLPDVTQAKKNFSLMLHERRYISGERSGKLYFSRMEDLDVHAWPETFVEITEAGDHFVFTFSISPVKSFLFTPIATGNRLKFHIDKEVLPEWKYLRVD